MHDTAGPEKFGMLRDAYYIGAHAGLLLFDVTSRVTYKVSEGFFLDSIVDLCAVARRAFRCIGAISG